MISSELSSAPDGQIPASPTSKPRFLRRWFVLLPVAVLLGSTGIAWLEAQRGGGPTISWSQPEALEFLVPNETRTVNMTFRSSERQTNVVAEVTPSLSSVVSLNPLTFPVINANQTYSLALQLRAGATSGIRLDGTLQLRSSGKSSGTYAVPLPITLVIYNEPVPPDPGEAGKETIVGVDSDGNGVRDDVQRFIISAHLSTPYLPALFQSARSLQAILAADPTELPPLRIELIRANDCLEYRVGAKQAMGLWRELIAETLNTGARSGVYTKAQSVLGRGGYMLTPLSQLESACR